MSSLLDSLLSPSTPVNGSTSGNAPAPTNLFQSILNGAVTGGLTEVLATPTGQQAQAAAAKSAVASVTTSWTFWAILAALVGFLAWRAFE